MASQVADEAAHVESWSGGRLAEKRRAAYWSWLSAGAASLHQTTSEEKRPNRTRSAISFAGGSTPR